MERTRSIVSKLQVVGLQERQKELVAADSPLQSAVTPRGQRSPPTLQDTLHEECNVKVNIHLEIGRNK
jgi:hypothetical protein